MRILLTALLLASSAFPVAPAQAEEPVPGVYRALGGWGDLTITDRGTFSINTISPFGHECELAGALNGNEGVDVIADDDTVCRIELKPADGGYDVREASDSECRTRCGARGMFAWEYRPLLPQCDTAAFDSRREQYLALYRAKKYAAALAQAEALSTECGGVQYITQADRLLSEIALMHYHLGRPQACLDTLRTTALGDATDLDEVGYQMPRFQAEMYESVASAILHNRKLCQAALKR